MLTRRAFGRAVAATASLPVLPALPAAAPVAAATTHQQMWATAIARAQGGLTPAMLSRHLGLAPEAARGLVTHLANQGVLGRVTATGTARALHPIARNATRLSQRPALDTLRTAIDALDHLATPAPDTAQGISPVAYPPEKSPATE